MDERDWLKYFDKSGVVIKGKENDDDANELYAVTIPLVRMLQSMKKSIYPISPEGFDNFVSDMLTGILLIGLDDVDEAMRVVKCVPEKIEDFDQKINK